MNCKLWIQKAISMCLVIAVIVVYSTAIFARSGKIAGELQVSGKGINGQTPSIKVNGEVAQNGRSIFTASTIATPDNTNAVINLGKAGKIELAPNTVVSLSFDEKTISGNLSAGRVTVLNAFQSVSLTTAEGKVVELNAGESAEAAGAQTSSDDDDNGSSFLLYAVILGGAAVGIILAATTDSNRIALGGGTTVVSSTR